MGARVADALIILGAGAFAVDDADADAKGVAGAEFGDRLGRLELLDGLGLEGLDEVHFTCLHSRAARQRATDRVRPHDDPSGPAALTVCPGPPFASARRRSSHAPPIAALQGSCTLPIHKVKSETSGVGQES